jgi:hypothetical protein
MIFGGCETATNGGRYYGNLMKTAKRLGVHSVIGFSGLIYYPYLGTPNASHRSGDFFWSRFAVYLRKGFTIDAAWHRALADMVTINKPYGGVTDGYQNLVIGGASPDPGNLQLTITGSDAAAVVDQNAEHNRQGDLVEFSANASSSGAIRRTRSRHPVPCRARAAYRKPAPERRVREPREPCGGREARKLHLPLARRRCPRPGDRAGRGGSAHCQGRVRGGWARNVIQHTVCRDSP